MGRYLTIERPFNLSVFLFTFRPFSPPFGCLSCSACHELRSRWGEKRKRKRHRINWATFFSPLLLFLKNKQTKTHAGCLWPSFELALDLWHWWLCWSRGLMNTNSPPTPTPTPFRDVGESAASVASTVCVCAAAVVRRRTRQQEQRARQKRIKK